MRLLPPRKHVRRRRHQQIEQVLEGQDLSRLRKAIAYTGCRDGARLHVVQRQDCAVGARGSSSAGSWFLKAAASSTIVLDASRSWACTTSKCPTKLAPVSAQPVIVSRSTCSVIPNYEVPCSRPPWPSGALRAARPLFIAICPWSPAFQLRKPELAQQHHRRHAEHPSQNQGHRSQPKSEARRGVVSRVAFVVWLLHSGFFLHRTGRLPDRVVEWKGWTFTAWLKTDR